MKKGNNSRQVSKALYDKLRGGIIQALEESCLLVQGTAKQICPRGKKWGHNVKEKDMISSASQLANSIDYEVNKSTLQGTVFTNVKYALHVEYATKAHEIKPKDKKALAWGRAVGKTRDGDTKRETVRKSVWHPGTSAQPFMRPALDINRDNIKRIFAHHINHLK